MKENLPPRHFVLVLAGLVSLAVCFGCDSNKSTTVPEGSGPLRIVVSTGMLADTVRMVAGEHAEVTALMGPGIDPHLYKPTRSDIATLNQADLVFYNGIYLEGRMSDAFGRLKAAGVPVYAVGELIDSKLLRAPEGLETHPDPHIWMDPSIWSEIVPHIRAALIQRLPELSAEIEANASAAQASLAKLDEFSERVLGRVPKNARVLVTAHDAFGYFGARYNYEVIGIQGLSTESEAGVRDIERIVSLLVERKIPAVFVESTVSERNVRALIEGAAAAGHVVTVGGELFSDAMGQNGTPEGTYQGMISHNVRTIARALGGASLEKTAAEEVEKRK